jgi:hypothetical protein
MIHEGRRQEAGGSGWLIYFLIFPDNAIVLSDNKILCIVEMFNIKALPISPE